MICIHYLGNSPKSNGFAKLLTTPLTTKLKSSLSISDQTHVVKKLQYVVVEVPYVTYG